MSDRRTAPTRRFAGWRILVLAIITASLTAPGQTIGVSVFVESFIADLGLSRDAVALAYLVGTLLGALGMPWAGRRIDLAGVRLAMTWVGLAFGGALIFMSGVRGFVSLALGYSLIRFLGQGALSLTSTLAVTHWFDRRRGLALGIMATAVSALMALAPIGLNQIIERTSWRVAWLAAAVTIWVVVVPIARFGMVDRPAVIGQVPDGAVSDDPGAAPVVSSLTRSQAIRTGRLWLVLAASATTGMLSTALNFHQIGLLGEAGLTSAEAALMFAPQVVGSSIAGMMFGALADRVKGRWLILGAMGLLATTLVLGSQLTTVGTIVAYAVTLGAAGGATRTVNAALPPRWFGVGHIGAIQGFLAFTNVASTALGPLALSMGRGAAGAYGPVLFAAAAVPLLVVVAAALIPMSDN